MLGSSVFGQEIVYPDSSISFSPDERYPEYAFDDVAERPNRVYEAMRRVLAQSGLDSEHYGTSAWNPLGSFLSPGQRVFILCNFVCHRRFQETERAFFAKCIHGSALRALCDYVWLAVGPSGSIQFGNAPLQACHWDRVISETGASKVVDFYQKEGLPISAKDLRLWVAHSDLMGRVVATEERGSDDAVEIDLGDASYLDEIAVGEHGPARFRISDYKPERIEGFHAARRHRYVIHRDVLEADAVVSLSKLKTHEKVGITCGLKGLVGMVGHKDCLAHHRFGGPDRGGDEYPPSQRILHPVSRFQDFVQARDTGAPFQGALQVVDRTARRIIRRLGGRMAGAWYGNDTCWRMALDLARIAHYADADGVMQSTPQRRHLSFIDGVVAGENDGPLAPTPVSGGALSFSDDVVWGDHLASRLMGFDPRAIPLLREALRSGRYPLVAEPGSPPEVVLNGRSVPLETVQPLPSGPFQPPSGWRGHL
jgi:uncharacterized protein (DUF362 family)